MDIRWACLIFGLTFGISIALSYISNELMNRASLGVSYLILCLIISIGILFDIIGVAVTAALEQPFHSMAAQKIPEATIALRLLRKAERVSSFCNDVIGDICGVISGSASAVIAAEAVIGTNSTVAMIVMLLMSALVAGLTVGGKALGKSISMNNSIAIVHITAIIIYRVDRALSQVKRFFSRK